MQNTILTTMGLERYILDEWVYIPAMMLIMLWSFGLGFGLGVVMGF
jgi:hypothetical protein